MEGHRVRRQRSSTTKTKQPEPLERIQPNAAGIDCGSRHHHVAVPVDRDPEPVRRFKTFTPDLYRMVDWLEACRIDTVAMEATGVYWIPILRHPRTARLQGGARQRSSREERPGTQD